MGSLRVSNAGALGKSCISSFVRWYIWFVKAAIVEEKAWIWS